ncbi:hypothetical protein AK88_01298 [Plasmodium fragile]|uniref:Midasin n=1 Tax=Plasmodium fragile TaxID=5857 RepID=A0A0D9QTK1_PLAFR|nr:uncharacterized protein AK88_01298 [Plasmodium fragile]KJP89006.1 hypothetical protein AK88_01298 [Plasmodium fragile]
MKTRADRTKLLWCEEIISHIRAWKSPICKDKTTWIDRSNQEEDSSQRRRSKKDCPYFERNCVKHIYKNCFLLHKLLRHKAYAARLKRRNAHAPLAQNVHVTNGGSSDDVCGMEARQVVHTPTAETLCTDLGRTTLTTILKQEMLGKPSRGVRTRGHKYTTDLILTQTIILTLFEPSLLKISLKYFNLLTASIVNQIFQEALHLASYNYCNGGDQKERAKTDCVVTMNVMRRGRETTIGGGDKPPVLHIYNLIKKYNINVELYFCMICMNSILFSKDSFFKSAIDYFFKEVFPKSAHCYGYFYAIVSRYLKEQNCPLVEGIGVNHEEGIFSIPVKHPSFSTYTYYCIQMLLLFCHLSLEKTLDRAYLNLLPAILKCKRRNPFLEDLIYQIYLHYHEIGRTVFVEDILTNQLVRKKDVTPSEGSPLFECSIVTAHNGEVIDDASRDIRCVLLKHGYNIHNLHYLHLDKFRVNREDNACVKFCVDIESVVYPSFCIKGREFKRAKREGPNKFVLTRRLKSVIEMIVTNIYDNRPTILIGSQGSGKTSLINYIHEKIFENEKEKKGNVISLYLDDVVDSKSILGIWESNEKRFEFKFGVLAKAMMSGNWIVFENVNNISSSVVEKLCEFTSKGHIYLSEKGEHIYPHKDFRLFGTITVGDAVRGVSGVGGADGISRISGDEPTLKGQLSELVRLNQRPSHLSSLFNKWHSVHIGSYREEEVEEILRKKLKHGVNENYRAVILQAYHSVKTLLEKYPLFRSINLHDLIKIIKRVKKRKIFMHENEKTGSILFQTCKSILTSHVPNCNLRSYFQKKLLKIFDLQEKIVTKWLQLNTLNEYMEQFNETLRKEKGKICLHCEKITNPSFLLTSVHKSILYEIIEGVHNKESILLIGDTGVGKTALVDYVAKIFRKKLLVFVFSEQSEASDLIGHYYPFNISVKTNELFEELKILNSQLGKQLCPKELDMLYLKLKIVLSEKKFITFLNTCRNFAKCLVEKFENDTSIFDMSVVKKYRIFQHDCEGVIHFWTSGGGISGRGSEARNRDGNNFPALKLQFDKFFQTGGQPNGDLIRSNSCEAPPEEQQQEEESNTNANELIFKFHDGILIDCIRNGYWLLLDEINLAQTEILQRLQGLLDLSNKYFDVVEKGNEQIKIHPNFRLFACMNPPIIPNLKKGKGSIVGGEAKKKEGEVVNNGRRDNNSLHQGDHVNTDEVDEDEHHIDLYNSSISSGKKELPPILRNKFTEIFVDEILQYEDVEMVVKHLLRKVTSDGELIKNITNCYLEVKKETVRNGFVCNFLSSVSVNDEKVMDHIFNKHFKCGPGKKGAQQSGGVQNEKSMQIEKNGVINYAMLESYYQYKHFDTKKGTSTEINDLSCFVKNSSVAKRDQVEKQGQEQHPRGGETKTSDHVDKYACVENSWILCGREQINLVNILSHFIITKNVKENIRKLALCLSGSKTPILLEGNTSVGKTSLVKFFADITGHKFVRINNHMNTDINEYFGQFVNNPSTGNLIFEEGIFVKAVRNGYWVVLDELNLAPSEVLESLNRILDDNKELYIPELKRYVKAHKDFMLFATQNPANNNNYLGRKELSKAFRSRFIEFYINDFEENELEIILHRRCAISPSIAKKMIRVFSQLRIVKSNYNYFNDNLMTLRDLIKWGNRCPRSNEDACLQGYYIIAEKLRNEKDQRTVKGILSENFLPKGEELLVNYEDDRDVLLLKEAFWKKISHLDGSVDVDGSIMMSTGEQDDVGEKPQNFSHDDVARVEYLKNMHLGKSTSRILCLLLKCFKHKESALLIGETGCGKTTCCELLSFVKNQKLNILNCNESTDVYDIIGSLKLVRNKKENFEKVKKNCIELYNEILSHYGDTSAANYLSGIIHDQIREVKKEDLLIFTLYLQKRYTLSESIKNKLLKLEKSINNLKSLFTWFDGILVSSLKKGDIFLMDEISLVESAVIERLNSVLEYERTLLLTEKGGKDIQNVKAHDEFCFIGTMNPSGDFGKKEISQTLKNRFTEIFVAPFAYDSEDYYFLILKQMKFSKVKNLKCATADCLRRLFQQIAQNKSLTNDVILSVRDTIKWISFMNIYVSRRKEMIYLRRGVKPKMRTLKWYIMKSFFHSGFLILIDGKEDAKTKTVLKELLRRSLLHLASSINFNVAKKGVQKSEGLTRIVEALFNQTYNFKFKRKYLQVNDFRIKFRKKLTTPFDQFVQNCQFVFDTPNIKKNLFKIIRAMQLDNSILLEGSPGVGKTCIINILAKLTNNKLIRINLSECTDIYDLVGSYFPIKDEKRTGPKSGNQDKGNNQVFHKGGEEEGEEQIYDGCKTGEPAKSSFQYVWKDGKLIECMKKGYWILIDEINLANQQTLEGINSILDHRKEIFIPETNEMVRCHPNFRLFCCQNPYSEGGGRKGLPKSFLNRFSKIYFEELNEEDYLCIVQRLYGSCIPKEDIQKIISVAFLMKKINPLLRDSECWVWNLRDILRICKFLQATGGTAGDCDTPCWGGTSFVPICDMLVCSRLTCAEDKEIVRFVIANVYSGCGIWGECGGTRREEFLKRVSEATSRESLLAGVRNTEVNHLNAFYTNLYYHEANLSAAYEWTRKSVLGRMRKVPSQVRPSTFLLSKDEKIYYACEAAIRLSIPILLIGKNNSGKSTFVNQLAHTFEKKLFEFALTNDMDTFDLFGCYEHNSRDNVIKKVERKMHNLNKLLLRNILRRKNFKKFYNSYFSKGKLQRRSKRIKINIMVRLNYLAHEFISALTKGDVSDEDAMSAERNYVHFVKTSLKTTTIMKNKCRRRKVRIEKTLLDITHLFETIRKNNINENVYIYNEGNFIKAIRNGHWVLVKHVHLSTPSLLDRLNSLFEENGNMLLHEFGKKKKIKPHKNFQIFLTLNSEEHYKISKALRNRCFEIHFGGPSCEYVGNAVNLYDQSGGSIFATDDPSPFYRTTDTVEEQSSEEGARAESAASSEAAIFEGNNMDAEQSSTPDRSIVMHVANMCFSGARSREIEVNDTEVKAEEQEYLNLVSKGNVLHYMMQAFSKKLQKEVGDGSRDVAINPAVASAGDRGEDVKAEMVTLFFDKRNIKTNCTKMMDYVNYCYERFLNVKGVRPTTDIIYFCVAISMTLYLMEYMLGEEEVTEKRRQIARMMEQENWKRKNIKWYKNFKIHLSALLNHKFENNFYHVDNYIMYMCSHFLRVRKNQIDGEKKVVPLFKQWKEIFSNSFVNFYCQMYSKLNEKTQLYFFPFFECLHKCVLRTILDIKNGIRYFVKSGNLQHVCIGRMNCSNKFAHRIKSRHFIYFYFYCFINYVNTYYRSYRKERKRGPFASDAGACPPLYITKEMALVNSMSNLKLNRLFCYSVYCFLENFSYNDLFYRYEHLLNIKNRMILSGNVHDQVHMVKYLDFIASRVIRGKMDYFAVMRDCVFVSIGGGCSGNLLTAARDTLRPLPTARKHLLAKEDQKLAKRQYLFEAFLKWHLSYKYFESYHHFAISQCVAKCQNNSECGPAAKSTRTTDRRVWLLTNKFLMHVEEILFKMTQNGSSSREDEDAFSYYLFLYLFTFDYLCNFKSDAMYLKIIFLVDAVKYAFKWDKCFKHNCRLMKFLQKAKRVADWRELHTTVEDIQAGSHWDQSENSPLNNLNRMKEKMKWWREPSRKEQMIVLTPSIEYFSNQWVKNVFEIVNNIYISHFIQSVNLGRYYYAMLSRSVSGVEEGKRISPLYSFLYDGEQGQNVDDDVENLLIQTKSFSYALKVLPHDHPKVTHMEKLIMNSLGTKKEVIHMGEFTSKEKLQPMEGYQNEEGSEQDGRKDFPPNGDNSDGKGNQLFSHYQFMIFNIDLKYLHNTFVYFLNTYMWLKWQQLYDQAGGAQKKTVEASYPGEGSHRRNISDTVVERVKEDIQQMYNYLRGMEKTIFVQEEKIEVLSLLKEKYGRLEWAQQQRRQSDAEDAPRTALANAAPKEESDPFELQVIFSIMEELLNILYCFLMNVYLVKDKSYDYAKEDVNHVQFYHNDEETNYSPGFFSEGWGAYQGVSPYWSGNNTIEPITNIEKGTRIKRYHTAATLHEMKRNNVTYEGYTLFKDIYVNKCFDETSTFRLYPYVCSSLVNKTVIFDSVVSVYQDLRRKKITLFYLNMSNVIFRNLKRSYQDYVERAAPKAMVPPSAAMSTVCLPGEETFWTSKRLLNSRGESSTRYYFAFHAMTILFNILNSEALKGEETKSDRLLLYILELFRFIIDGKGKKASPEMLLHLLEIHRCMRSLTDKVFYLEKSQKYVFAVLFILFKFILSNLQSHNGGGEKGSPINASEVMFRSHDSLFPDTQHHMHPSTGDYLPAKCTIDDSKKCINEGTATCEYVEGIKDEPSENPEELYSWMEHALGKTNKEVREMLYLLFPDHLIAVDLTEKYEEEEFLFSLGCLYISHYFLNVICSQVRKEIKNIFKQMEVKSYVNKSVASLKEEIYMGSQHNMYIEKVNPFAQVSYSDFIKMRRKKQLKGHIKNMNMNVPLLPKVLQNIKKGKKKKKLENLLFRCEKNNNPCAYFIKGYISKNSAKNMQTLYLELKNEHKEFIKNLLPLDSIENNVLLALINSDDLINPSVINTCLNFAHHVKENKERGECGKMERRTTIPRGILQLDRKGNKRNDLYRCIKFPLNFNKILKLKKNCYESQIDDMEYLHFVTKMLRKPRNISTQFDVAFLLPLLKRMCRKIVIYNEKDEMDNMNEFLKIDQFKSRTAKEMHQSLVDRDFIERNIEQELDSVFYSKEYFSTQAMEVTSVGGGTKRVASEDDMEEDSRAEDMENADLERGQQDSSERDTKEVDTEKPNEAFFNKIVYKMAKLFKRGKYTNGKKPPRSEIEITKKSIRHTLDMLIRLHCGEDGMRKDPKCVEKKTSVISSYAKGVEGQNGCTFLLRKKNEEKRLLLFTLNMLNQFSDLTKYNDNKFAIFKKKIAECLQNCRNKNHIYINNYVNLLDDNFMEYIFSALNDLCFLLINLKDKFVPIYNESGNINVCSILNVINNILSFSINNIDNEIEKIIHKLEHLVTLILSLKNDNYVSFDEVTMRKVKEVMHNNAPEDLLIYTVYFRLYKLNSVKIIRKNLNRKIVKKRTLSLFSYMFYLCYDDTQGEELNRGANGVNITQGNYYSESGNVVQNNPNNCDNDAHLENLAKVKIVKTFETLVIFLRDSMVGEFPARLNLIDFIAHLFKNSERQSERMMSNVFSNVYSYMRIYLPLIKKRIEDSKKYFDVQLRMALEKMNFDLVDLEAYKWSIMKLKRKIAYFTKLYFQQISVTVDKLIVQNGPSFGSEGKGGSRAHGENYSFAKNGIDDTFADPRADEVSPDVHSSSGSSVAEEEEEQQQQNGATIDSSEEDEKKAVCQNDGDNDEGEDNTTTPAEEKQNRFHDQLNELKESLTRLRKKVKTKKPLDQFLTNMDLHNNFEDISRNYVAEVRNILNVQCRDAGVGQKKRWIYILKHFLSKKLNIPAMKNLDNFNLFSSVFQNDIHFCDSTKGSLFGLEYRCPEEILAELQNCLKYMIEQDDTLNDEEVKSKEMKQVNEEVFLMGEQLQKDVKRNRLCTLHFLDEINNILKHNEEKNAEILHLTIYIKSLSIHEDMANDDALYYLFNAIICEYFNLRKEVNIFYHHFVCYYLLVTTLLCEKRYGLDYIHVDFATFEKFLEKCNLVKGALLQVLSVGFGATACKMDRERASNFFRRALKCVYKMAYMIYSSNEFRIFNYFRNVYTSTGGKLLEQFGISLPCMKLRMNVNFLECLNTCVKFLRDNLSEIFALHVAPYFKDKIHAQVIKLVDLFYQMKGDATVATAHCEEISPPFVKDQKQNWDNPPQEDQVEKLNDQMCRFISNVVQKKSIIYIRDYPDFQNQKNVNEMYCMKDIIQMYLTLQTNCDLFMGSERESKSIKVFHYLNKNLFYFTKCVLLYMLDIFLGFSNVSLYFLKVLKILYTKGLCREAANEKDAMKETKEEEDIFHKVDFLQGIGLGEGKGIKNISNQVDNEDLDNMCHEDENNFSQDENDFDEEAIEATYNFEKFCEKELPGGEQQSGENNSSKLENEQNNLDMEKKGQRKEEENNMHNEANRRDGEKNEAAESEADPQGGNEQQHPIDDVLEQNNSNQWDVSERSGALNDALKEGDADSEMAEKGEEDPEDNPDREAQKPEQPIEGNRTDEPSREALNDQKTVNVDNDEGNTNELPNAEQNDNCDLTNEQQAGNQGADHLDDLMGERNNLLNGESHEMNDQFDFNLDSNFEIESSDFSKSCSEGSFASREDNFDADSDEEMGQEDQAAGAKREEGDASRRNEREFSEQDPGEVDIRHDVEELDENASQEGEAAEQSDEAYDGDQSDMEQLDQFDTDKRTNDQRGKGFMSGQVEPQEGQADQGAEESESADGMDGADDAEDRSDGTLPLDDEKSNDQIGDQSDDQIDDQLGEEPTAEACKERDAPAEAQSYNEPFEESERCTAEEDTHNVEAQGERKPTRPGDEHNERRDKFGEAVNGDINSEEEFQDEYQDGKTRKAPPAGHMDLDKDPHEMDNTTHNLDDAGISNEQEFNQRDDAKADVSNRQTERDGSSRRGKSDQKDNNDDHGSGANDISFSIDKCNIYTKNFVDITNFIEKINERLLNMGRENESVENEKARKDSQRVNENFNVTTEEHDRSKEEENMNGEMLMDVVTTGEMQPVERMSERDVQEMKPSEKHEEDTHEGNEEKSKYSNEANAKRVPRERKDMMDVNSGGDDSEEDKADQLEGQVSDQESDFPSTDNGSRGKARKAARDPYETTFEEEANNKDVDIAETERSVHYSEENAKTRKKEEKENAKKDEEYYKLHRNEKALEREYTEDVDGEENVDQKKVNLGEGATELALINEQVTAEYEEIYDQINNETEVMSSQLCEQLKIILEPTVRNKYQGDYKSGKKLNIKKLVNYFASDFRNNKIWKRRTKLNKRDYNIVIAIDNTKSMQINNIQKITLNAIFLVARAFEKLQVGRIGICSFGENDNGISANNVVCAMKNSLNKQDFLKILNHFQFNHDTKNSFDNAMLNALRICNYILKNTHSSTPQNGGKNVVSHLMLIISDGRFNKSTVKAEIFKCIQNNFIPVLMIIDTQLSNNKAQSIFNLKQTFYKDNKLHIVPYLHDFPFPYFVVVNDINEIPTLMCDIIRQWFQTLNSR